MSQNKWISLITTSKPYQLSLIEGKLLEHGINSVIINKIDSSYLNFGEAELKVRESDFDKAQEILKNVEE
jgi:hypothetical protein